MGCGSRVPGVVVYVDDMLGGRASRHCGCCCADRPPHVGTSDPEFAAVDGAPMRFLGMEIEKKQDGSFFVHQGSYTRELLERHGTTKGCSYVRVPDEGGGECLSRVYSTSAEDYR